MNELTPSQREAYLNEFKGNLFEFLFAQKIAQDFAIEENFFSSLPKNFFDRLSSYEDFIRRIDPLLFSKLPELTAKVYLDFRKKLSKKVLQVQLIGKMAGENERENWGEGDIILHTQDAIIPVSLKISKNNAFVNTKSAGVKSFLEKYFSSFQDACELQRKFNEKIEKDFYDLAHTLYQIADLPFLGKFDDEWMKAGLSELPGEVGPEFSEKILKYYAGLTHYLYEVLRDFSQKNPELFLKAFPPLVGLKRDDIIQVICFYDDYDFAKTKIFDSLSLKPFQFLSYNKEKSSFEIEFPHFVFQLRLKPMNKFTVPSLKVNCSIKVIS